MNIAICDDDIEYVNQIDELLQSYKEEYHLKIDKYTVGEEVINALKKGILYDMVFLDIEMDETSGLDVAKYIRERNREIMITFVTSHVNYVSDTFRLGAFQFLLKPIDEAVFKSDFERALETYRIKHEKYMVRWRDVSSVIECGDIYYIESYNRHIYIQMELNGYECVGKLTDEYEKLKKYDFARCHQGYIVNMSKIRQVDKDSVLLKNGKKIPISRRLKNEFMDEFNLYLAGRIV